MKKTKMSGCPLPMKSAGEELDFLRRIFREIISALFPHGREIVQIREAVAAEQKKKNFPRPVFAMHGHRTLIRALDVKTEKGAAAI